MNRRPRSIDELTASALKVIQQGIWAGGYRMAPLYSSGHDSQVACHLASQHKEFPGKVFNIDTGIGADYSLRHVEEVCDDHGWQLERLKSPVTYESIVRQIGFPGPGRHQWTYNRLKDRCVRMIVKRQRKQSTLLITGCRKDESTRRMGHVEPIKIGERSKAGCLYERKRIWCAPCHDWTVAEQVAYMNHHGLPRNKLKERLGMSGECFCGAFAAPGEREKIRVHAPDVERKLIALTTIAEESGTPSKWGERPPRDKGIVIGETGPLCSGCDRRAHAAGIKIRCV